ncbi:hypothetical protein M8818_002229 [Zalaria obscura]|uniref:Uncharacterized protein n=1 Tax=Zalaria obscura TaxID=2024903 RepID=A0ACC3SI82_9PEZI
MSSPVRWSWRCDSLSRTVSVASITSGPMPSPGKTAMLYVLSAMGMCTVGWNFRSHQSKGMRPHSSKHLVLTESGLLPRRGRPRTAYLHLNEGKLGTHVIPQGTFNVINGKDNEHQQHPLAPSLAPSDVNSVDSPHWNQRRFTTVDWVLPFVTDCSQRELSRRLLEPVFDALGTADAQLQRNILHFSRAVESPPLYVRTLASDYEDVVLRSNGGRRRGDGGFHGCHTADIALGYALSPGPPLGSSWRDEIYLASDIRTSPSA